MDESTSGVRRKPAGAVNNDVVLRGCFLDCGDIFEVAEGDSVDVFGVEVGGLGGVSDEDGDFEGLDLRVGRSEEGGEDSMLAFS